MISQITPDRFGGTGHYGTVRIVRGSSRPAAEEVIALVDRARQGESAAFEDLFRTHVEQVHRMIYRLLGPVPEVEDFVQIAFVEAFRSLPAFRGDALFSTWLARIAVRVTMHGVKRRPPRSLPLEAQTELATDTPGPERTAAAREALAILDRLLADLRPKRRAAFVLHVLEGYSVDEVGAILDASTSAIKVRIHDARRALERQLKHRPDLLDSLTRGGEA